MLHPEIEKIDSEVQTSLEYLDPVTKEQFEEELRKLREDKFLLEGKIRGYLTLSDICHEYKEELSRLQKEYNSLKDKVSAHASFSMNTQSSKNESSTPDNDLGTVNGREHEHRTQSHDPTNNHLPSKSFNIVGSVATNILKDKELPVRTKELFDLVEDPQKSSEGTKSMPPFSTESALPYHDKFPMQESMAHESNKSVTGLGFDHVPSDDLALGQSAGNMGRKKSGDLMNFSVPQSYNYKNQLSSHDQELEDILKSVQLESDKIELQTVVEVVKKYSNSQHEKLQKSNHILLSENNEFKKKNKQLKEDNSRLVEKVRSLEKQLYDISNSLSRSPTPNGNAQMGGWVHVEKLSHVQNGPVTKTTEPHQRTPANSEDIEMLKQKNQQLTDANQRWSSEWNKLLAHYDHRIADLQTERDRMAKELTDFKISEEAKQRDYEKMLMNAKKKAAEEENGKEEALLMLTTANNRADAFQAQLREYEDTITALRREKQVIETELSVIRQRPVTPSGSAPEAARTGRSQMDLQTENEVLRQQLLVFQEDFDRERHDRAKAQSLKDDYKKQNEQYKKRVRHLEQKNISFEGKLKSAEESIRRLQEENSTLKLQLQREQEKNQAYIRSQVAYQPVVQSSGMQPQRQFIFGQQVQHRPQQYVIQPTYDQRLPQLNGGMYMSPQYQPVQGVVNPPAPYYQANQAGRQTEYKEGSWSCNQCTYVNYPGRTVCEVCGYIQSPSANQNNFVYRQNGNETLHARGEPLQPQPRPPPQQQQQPPPFGYGGTPAQRNVPNGNIN